MKQNNYTYDIAFSFANEDLKIAKKIAKELKRLKITYYLYTEEITLASNLTESTWNVYTQESRFVLVLISKHYKEKKWAGREWDAIQTVHRPKGIPYTIFLRIDDTELPGLHPDIIFSKWKRNASHIAISLYELIHFKERAINDTKNKNKSTKKKKKKQKNVGVSIKSKNMKGNIISGRNSTIN